MPSLSETILSNIMDRIEPSCGECPFCTRATCSGGRKEWTCWLTNEDVSAAAPSSQHESCPVGRVVTAPARLETKNYIIMGVGDDIVSIHDKRKERPADMLIPVLGWDMERIVKVCRAIGGLYTELKNLDEGDEQC